jgi:uncharacterized protein
MKVARIEHKTRAIEGSSKDKIKKTGDFSDAFDMANRNQSEQQLQQMLIDIEKLGGKLVKTQSLADAKQFRNKVREYLSYIIKNTYSLKTDTSTFSYGVHMRVEVIDQKLEELTKDLIENQKGAIDLADRVEEIKGLLVDVKK